MERIIIPLRPKTSVLTQALAASCPANPTAVRDYTCLVDNGLAKRNLMLARLDVDPTSTITKSQLTDSTFVLDTSASTTASSSTGGSSGPHTPLSSDPTSPMSCYSLDVEFEKDDGSPRYPAEPPDTNPHTSTDKAEAQASVSRCLEELSRLITSFGFGVFEQSHHERPYGEDKTTAGSETPGNGGPSSGPSSSQSRKRTSGQGNSGDEDPYSKEGQEDNGGDDSATRSKKIKVEDSKSQYPCPYRKRNPLRFNIRDHNTCATNTSADLPNLKRHIKQHHKRQASLPYACYRCGADQGTRDQLTWHLQLPSERLCVVRQASLSHDPEEGITPAVEDMLNERKSGTRVNTWRSLCRALFPEDDRILSSVFEPPVELDEVGREFDLTKDELRNRLRLESQSIAELSPEAQDYVAAQMERASWDYIQSVLVGSRLDAGHSSGKYQGRRRNHKQGTNQPLAQDGVPSSATTLPRQILPKPFSVAGSAWQSPTSSWKTDNSDLSSCPPLSGTSCSSTASQNNQQLGVCHDGYIGPASHVGTSVGTDRPCCFTDEDTRKRQGMDPGNLNTYQLASSLPMLVATWSTPSIDPSWATPVETSGQQLQQGNNVSFAMMVEDTFQGQGSSIPSVAAGSHAMELYPAGFYSIFDGS